MLTLIRHRLTRRVLFTLLAELILLNAGIAGLLYLRQSIWSEGRFEHLVLFFALACTGVIQFGLWSFGLYSRQVVYSGRRVLPNMAGAFAALSVLLFPVCYLFSLTGVPVFSFTLKFYLLLLGSFMGLVTLERLVVLRLFRDRSQYGNILILGVTTCTSELIREARRHHGATLRFTGILSADPRDLGGSFQGIPVLGLLHEVREVCERYQIRTMILCEPADSEHLPLDALLELRISGVDLFDAARFYETIAHKVLLEKVEPYEVLFPSGYGMTRLRWAFKSGSERMLAALMLALSGPLLLVLMALIRLTSPGRAIYRQPRVGRGGRVFTLYKLRTMVEDAERNTGPVWADRSDRRTTWIGKWLRKTRLDELPQLVNILKGDMAFVGPRPERPEFVGRLTKRIPYYHHRHFVKPGLTGWAQVSYPYGRTEADAREKLRYDLYYIKYMSPIFDFVIVLATLRAVLRGEGGVETAKEGAAQTVTAPSSRPTVTCGRPEEQASPLSRSKSPDELARGRSALGGVYATGTAVQAPGFRQKD